MLKSCTYCGKIHDRKIVCQSKRAAINKRMRKDSSRQEDRFRWSRAWKEKAELIKNRDCCLCQICTRELYDTRVRYNPYHLSVHHIVSLKDDFGSRFRDDNLITLCRKHHELAEGGGIPSTLLRAIAREQQANMVR